MVKWATCCRNICGQILPSAACTRAIAADVGVVVKGIPFGSALEIAGLFAGCRIDGCEQEIDAVFVEGIAGADDAAVRGGHKTRADR